ncbi:MAG: hypothetical protein A3G33_01715 [Omnitrophica bacterium RIFCSPLOWO2_12_FULL_44_17]|uniref:GDYXXLXY domain-containing protein n=1 Tax=Candidatus Danuiimicrobium aquiferis TaxID=1801832 RepID=A0A1G1KVN0_9BACT|nr:MAG: hypothetical protein A3B72_00945 [Omnitrophica bacterium RIFCSPHIGHO2_02_FULL_45_28]OGW92181.1 MAG: hypothetical protein A3E74_08690 [Omnitrophica bacterium RIFCSPHIGHO2_12_FULL_44_12]OGW96832.1 MAG: hypothetical protein A3G33_01715 [Omnitrophica bacterium RIFCSPLOWO2_12_FULL_44_17]OGX03833.1 MAG: hypothetical protein A3J12_09615 [Omnitrophica bacterium RIFCSPLOWO2_02_FULL_44_11]
MIKFSLKQGLWLTTLIWVLTVGGVWASHEYELSHGREIVLKTIPVDPIDFFRGEYVNLRYDISSLDRKLMPMFYGQSFPRMSRDAKIYAKLIEKDGVWNSEGFVFERPKDGVYLRGRVSLYGTPQLRVNYGIESYFVPEGEAKKYEAAQNQKRLYAVINVTSKGVGKLKHLEIR